MVGKLPPTLLNKYILSRVGIKDPAVIVGPSIGEDSAVIDLGDDKILVAHSDPITGAVELLGWLAVNIVSNDIAVTGAKPRWLLATIYLPEECDESLIDKITSQIDVAAKELKAMIVGGHTEFTPKLDRPLISMTGIGITTKDKFVKTGGAMEGDVVLMTKTAGIEGTAILSTDFSEELRSKGISNDIIKRGAKFIKRISVVKEALILAENKLATSMHDPTEGGVLGGLTEIAYASKKTIEVWEEKIPIATETQIIARALNIDILRLISSGVLIATIPKDKAEKAIELLKSNNIEASVIGIVREYSGNLVILNKRNGAKEYIEEVYVEDELIRLWKEYKK